MYGICATILNMKIVEDSSRLKTDSEKTMERQEISTVGDSAVNLEC